MNKSSQINIKDAVAIDADIMATYLDLSAPLQASDAQEVTARFMEEI